MAFQRLEHGLYFYSTFADFPTPAPNETFACARDSRQLYYYNSTVDQWLPFQFGSGSLDLEVDGTPNIDQTLLNLIAGTNINLTDDGFGGVIIDATGGGSSLSLSTDGTPNADQTLLNLVSGTNMQLTDDGFGSVTFDVLPEFLTQHRVAFGSASNEITDNAVFTYNILDDRMNFASTVNTNRGMFYNGTAAPSALSTFLGLGMDFRSPNAYVRLNNETTTYRSLVNINATGSEMSYRNISNTRTTGFLAEDQVARMGILPGLGGNGTAINLFDSTPQINMIANSGTLLLIDKATNQIVMGSSTNTMNKLWIGGGEAEPVSPNSQIAVTTADGISTPDVTGGDLKIIAGQASGTGVGGALLFQTTVEGLVSGVSLNPLSTWLSIQPILQSVRIDLGDFSNVKNQTKLSIWDDIQAAGFGTNYNGTYGYNFVTQWLADGSIGSIQMGDIAASLNGTIQVLDDVNSQFEWQAKIGGALTASDVLNFDGVGGVFQIGDVIGAQNGIKLVIYDTSQVAALGDVDGIFNNTYISPDDSSQIVTSNANFGVREICPQYNGIVRRVQVKVSLTAAQIKALNSTPLPVVPASTATSYWRCVSMDVNLTYVSVPFTSTLLVLQSNATLRGQRFCNILSETSNCFSHAERTQGAPTINYEPNTFLELSADADSAVGDSTIDVYLTLEEIEL